MKLYLEAVAVALICIVPQLHDQRVELKSSKLAEMEKARWEGRTAIFEESDIMELEDMLDLLLGKASDRTILSSWMVRSRAEWIRFIRSY
jgi:hypothetical protein